MKQKKIIFIVGPTAAGKTQAAFELAKKINGEIISCDAMQVYKEVSILSNKPQKSILQKIRHHLIGIIPISKNFDAAVFRKNALSAIKKVHAKKKIPIVTGGSGFYVAVLLDGIFQGAKKNESLRHLLEFQAQAKGNEFLHKRLAKIDPEAAQKIHPNDAKRIIRALEVFMTTGKTITQLKPKRQGLWGKFDIKIFAVNRAREELYRVINERVEEMFNAGAVEEVKKLVKKKWSKTAETIIGVREIKDYLSGRTDIARAKYLIQQKTRHYAKRQLTWFRREKRLKWLTVSQANPVSQIVLQIKKEMEL